ncbi:RNA polymerase sigma factor region1.1 domain-containing protein [Bradyrhizobium sp. URHD0069]|uniref:RNA polymerase sigma factor region1.1 domain-containing protein n=1 Tax=Bradyrhizobium sp. URHD0069 TaxID=1380355 RepID=UPI000496D8A9|nr:RNA polymerase sigma factor region1.1 domain-containing protein [Bradyrhizobium sp. URHD0069]
MDKQVEEAVRRASEAADTTGTLTFEKLNALLPNPTFTTEQVETLLNRLSERGIHIVEDG